MAAGSGRLGGAGAEHPPRSLEFEMGLSHGEFFRTLPAAMGAVPNRVEGLQIASVETGRCVRIELAPEGRRRIALLELPVTVVRLRFEGYTPAAVDEFMNYFMSRYQRGGG